MAASMPVQPSQLPKAFLAPAAVGVQDAPVIVTRVRVSPSTGSNRRW